MHNGSYLDPPGVGNLKAGELLLLFALLWITAEDGLQRHVAGAMRTARMPRWSCGRARARRRAYLERRSPLGPHQAVGRGDLERHAVRRLAGFSGNAFWHQPYYLLQPAASALRIFPQASAALTSPSSTPVGEYRQIGDHLAYTGEFVIVVMAVTAELATIT